MYILHLVLKIAKIVHGWFSAYDTKLVAMAMSYEKLKKRCRSVNFTKTLLYCEKIAKIGLVDPEIIRLN